MGTACGPSVANLFLAYFEIINFNSLKNSLKINWRFIDDLFFISKEKVNNEFFNDIYPITLNIASSNIVNFLDLNLSFDTKFSLKYDLYIKSTNTFSYLLCKSNHPKFIFDNIPKSLIFRIRRICSDINDFYLHCSTLHFNLIKRGNKSCKILPLVRYFSEVDRNNLINYITKDNQTSNLNYFSIYFDSNFYVMKNFIKDIWISSLNPNSFLKKTIFKICYKIYPNFNNYFVNSINCIFSSRNY